VKVSYLLYCRVVASSICRCDEYVKGPAVRAIVYCTLLIVLQAARAAAAPDTLEQTLGTEVGRFVEADRVSPPSPCQVLFVGSSSIVKWKDALAKDMAPMPVINRGFGGSQIEFINRWFDQVVAPYRPRAIVFYAGENDIDAGKSVAKVVADFDAFMARKSQALGKTPVYFISIKPSKLRFAQFSLQSQVNAAILARSDTRSDLYYVDVVSPMLENGKPKDIFERDDLHMTRAGYVIWARVVKEALLANSELELRECNRDRGGRDGWISLQISHAPTVSLYRDKQNLSAITLPLVSK